MSDTTQISAHVSTGTKDRLERLVREHTTGEIDRTHQVWSLLMLELWHRAFVDATELAAVA